jgi:hypothetical protein
MEELKSALEAHMDQMADLVQKLSSELRSGFRPAIDNFIGFFHAIDWTVPIFCLFFLKKIFRVYIEKRLNSCCVLFWTGTLVNGFNWIPFGVADTNSRFKETY